MNINRKGITVKLLSMTTSKPILQILVLTFCILLLAGCSDKSVRVPSVTDTAENMAVTVLTQAGLMLGSVNREYSDIIAVGYVISQNPSAGNNVDRGATVDLVISKGPDPTTASLNIFNESYEVISIANLWLSTSSAWGQNQLGYAIDTGETRTLHNIPPGSYNIRLVFRDNTVFTKSNISLVAGDTYYLYVTGTT